LKVYSNNSLINLDGLNNVTSIGGGLTINYNSTITNLEGLNNLTTIGGSIFIDNNSGLITLEGLDNIDPETISYIFILSNHSLSNCDAKSVCDYIASPNCNVGIDYNAPGCNSKEEVEEACLVSIDANTKPEFTIYPNPTKNKLFLSSKNGVTINEVTIYNQLGKKVLHKNRIFSSIDISMLGQGMYIIELFSGGTMIREKLIIEK